MPHIVTGVDAFGVEVKGPDGTVRRIPSRVKIWAAGVQASPPAGFPGWLMWLVVHVTFLTGLKNRFTSLLHWANTFPGGRRAERTRAFRQVMARVAIGQAGGDKFMQALILIPGTGTEPELEAAPGQNG